MRVTDHHLNDFTSNHDIQYLVHIRIRCLMTYYTSPNQERSTIDCEYPIGDDTYYMATHEMVRVPYPCH